MNERDKQRYQIIIASVLLLIAGIANYFNYYAPPKPIAKIFSFAAMSEPEQQDMLHAARKNGEFTKEKKSNKKDDKYYSEFEEKSIDVSSENLSDNYINYAVDSNGKLGRWESSKITVFVSSSEYQQSIYQALSHYNEVFEGYFRFYLTSKRENANIKIDMVNKFSGNQNNEYGYMAGLTDNVFSNGNRILKKSWIQILSTKPNSGKKVSQSEVYSVALHELGHALGIVGHSPNPDDIMYASSKVNDFSKRDISTIKIMYSGDEELIQAQTRNFARTKLNEAEEYAKKLPDKAVSWINLGRVYYDLDKKDEALDAYKKALTIEPQNPMIYRSMAECYYNSKKYETAIKYYSIAIDYTKTEEQKSSSYNMIGLCYAKLDNFEKAYPYFKKAFDVDRVNEQNLKNYLIACVQLDKKTEAMDAILKYKLTNPDIINDETIKDIYNWAK